MGASTIINIKKQKAKDHYGERNWKTFYCMKDDEGNYKAYDNNKHATFANTDEAIREGKKVTGGSNGIVYKKVTWDNCKNNVTLGGLKTCDKISSNFDEQEMVDDGMSSKTMGVQWEKTHDGCSGLVGPCSLFGGCGDECKLGTCHTYDLVKPSK